MKIILDHLLTLISVSKLKVNKKNNFKIIIISKLRIKAIKMRSKELLKLILKISSKLQQNMIFIIKNNFLSKINVHYNGEISKLYHYILYICQSKNMGYALDPPSFAQIDLF